MTGNLQTYHYTEPRRPGFLRIGVARHLPRGVRKEDYVRKDYFDLWLPILAPSPALVKQYRGGEITFGAFGRRYRKEIAHADAQAAIQLLAHLAVLRPIELGCFCEDACTCHRSILASLIEKAAPRVRQSPPSETPQGAASSPCMLDEFATELGYDDDEKQS